MAVHALAEVYQRIRRAGTTLVFVNTRAQAEIAFQALWHLNDDALPIALHHGSLAVGQRRKVEAAMAAGRLRAVVATSSDRKSVVLGKSGSVGVESGGRRT